MGRRLAVVTIVGSGLLAGCGGDGRSWTCVAVGDSTVCGTAEGEGVGVRAERLAPGLELRTSSDGRRSIVWTGPIGGAGASVGPTGPTATFSLSETGEVRVETAP